jgi:hypothetical protein
MELNMIMKEDIWDPSKMCIIGNVVRTAESSLAKRYDTNGNLVEIYDHKPRSEIAVVLPVVEPHCVCISAHNNNTHNDTLLVSTSPTGVITDYYLSVPVAVQYIQQFGLDASIANCGTEMMTRYSQDGQYMGIYCAGKLDLLIKKYGETHEFVTTIKNHYADILTKVRVAIKNFGNEAVCIFYDV